MVYAIEMQEAVVLQVIFRFVSTLSTYGHLWVISLSFKSSERHMQIMNLLEASAERLTKQSNSTMPVA